MPIDFDIGDGADALGRNQLSDALDGTYWVSGWDATLGTGDLEVDIASGEGAINGGDVSTGSTQTVDFTGDPDSTDPRKAVISVDDTGTVQKTLGLAAPAAPADEVRFRTYDPQPPTNAPGVVVAEVWLAAGVTSLTTDDVRSRRVPNQAAANATPNQPDWELDGNSPFTLGPSTTPEYTIDSTDFSFCKVLISRLENVDTSSGIPQIRVNNVAGEDWDYITVGAVETSDVDQIDINTESFAADQAVSFGFEIAEGQFNTLSVEFGPLLGDNFEVSTATTFAIADQEWPPQSIQFGFGGFSLNAEVEGSVWVR